MLARPERRRRAGELLDVVGMTAWADRKVATYSKGMMQRVGLGQALMADPDLVVLDEPTDGVDPVGRRDIRDVLDRLRRQGKTVFINSHLLSELEAVCDRVAILVQGRVAAQGTLDDLTAKTRRYDVEVEPGEGGMASVPERVGRAVGLILLPVVRDALDRPGRKVAVAHGRPALPSSGLPAEAMNASSGLVPGTMPGPPAAPLLPTPPLYRSAFPDGTWAELDGAVLSGGAGRSRGCSARRSRSRRWSWPSPRGSSAGGTTEVGATGLSLME